MCLEDVERQDGLVVVDLELGIKVNDTQLEYKFVDLSAGAK